VQQGTSSRYEVQQAAQQEEADLAGAAGGELQQAMRAPAGAAPVVRQASAEGHSGSRRGLAQAHGSRR